MKRKYTLVVEGDSAGYSAYVPELQTILVTGESPEELNSQASEAILLYLETIREEQSPTAVLREIEVELPV